MINYVKGSVFDSGAGVIAHGCNCKGGFGSGVAAEMTRRFPIVRMHYRDKFEGEGWKLGDVQFVKVYGGYVANCATQYDYGTDKRHADYNAIKDCMQKVKEFAKKENLTIAIPKIGAGLAGGDWRIIEQVLNEVFQDYDVTVHHLE